MSESNDCKSIRVLMPFHLRTIAGVAGEIELEVAAPFTQRRLIDTIEERFPALKGTIRDHGSAKRRPFLRFYACKRDLSNESPDAKLPDDVISGKETYMIIGGLAGG